MDQRLLRPKALPAKDNSIVKIAVEMSGLSPQLIEFNQKQPLSKIIVELCNNWNLTEPELYALKFNMEANKRFVSEKNRLEVKNGYVLQLGFSPVKLIPEIISRFKMHPDEILKAAQELGVLCNDITFCTEFIEKQGLEHLINLIEATENAKSKDPIMAALLPAFVDLMDHGITQWDILEAPFIKKIASLINNQTSAQDPRTLQASLSILESLVFNSNKYPQVDKELTIPNLAMHLQNSSPAIQTNALALINSLFLKADDFKRSSIAATLNVRQIRNSFVVNIIQGLTSFLSSNDFLNFFFISLFYINLVIHIIFLNYC